jgi:hypothetical protein
MLSKIRDYLTSPAFNYIRALLYVALPAWLLELAKQGRLSTDHANLWTAVVLAAAGPALAAVFAPGGWRTYLFALAIPVQGVLVGVGGLSNNALGLLALALLNSVAISGVAASNVHRSETEETPAANPGG